MGQFSRRITYAGSWPLTRSDNIEEKVSKRGLMTIYEPASGSGAIVIAMMSAMQNRGLSDSFMSA
jgi:hypothetical protein